MGAGLFWKTRRIPTLGLKLETNGTATAASPALAVAAVSKMTRRRSASGSAATPGSRADKGRAGFMEFLEGGDAPFVIKNRATPKIQKIF
jgi:hypothetical protein